jgi:hypothetical protein
MRILSPEIALLNAAGMSELARFGWTMSFYRYSSRPLYEWGAFHPYREGSRVVMVDRQFFMVNVNKSYSDREDIS